MGHHLNEQTERHRHRAKPRKYKSEMDLLSSRKTFGRHSERTGFGGFAARSAAPFRYFFDHDRRAGLPELDNLSWSCKSA
jgi:hypothetical protein